MKPRPNYIGSFWSIAWLLVVILPLYVMLQATFQTQAGFASSGPLSAPHSFTFGNYIEVFQNGMGLYLWNSFFVTASVVAIVLVLVVPLSYAVVRSQSRVTTNIFRIFLLGLAVPSQAIIVPMFYLISSLGLYDNLVGVILPTAAFCFPICTLVLSGSMRDITPDLYEAMSIDGASTIRTFFRLVVPLSRGGISTIIVFSAMQAWNGFLFPLILTQSANNRVVTLSLFSYQSQYAGANIPGLLAAVMISLLPMLGVYLFARRALINGLMGVGGK